MDGALILDRKGGVFVQECEFRACANVLVLVLVLILVLVLGLVLGSYRLVDTPQSHTLPTLLYSSSSLLPLIIGKSLDFFPSSVQNPSHADSDEIRVSWWWLRESFAPVVLVSCSSALGPPAASIFKPPMF